MKTTTTTNGTAPTLAATKLKLSTLIRIAQRLENELGRSPRCTVRQRQAQLAAIAGHCGTVASAEDAIREDLNA